MPPPQRTSHELRADIAALRRKVEELREWVEKQQAEIDRIRRASLDLAHPRRDAPGP